MSRRFIVRLVGVALAGLLLAACSTEDVIVTSYNFPESEIVGEIYAQALEAEGIAVDRSLNLGTRELLYPELRAGRVNIVAEYVGSGIIGQFGMDVPNNVDDAVDLLASLLSDDGLVVLRAAPGENNQAFVVASDRAEEHGWTNLSDLAQAGPMTFAGPPECEQRMTCFQGLVEHYGLNNLTFTAIQEPAPRLASLDNGDVDMILLFSTDAPLADPRYTVLIDDAYLLPPENLVPIISQDAIDAHPEIVEAINRVTERLTTDALRQMNVAVAEGRSAAEIAREFLAG